MCRQPRAVHGLFPGNLPALPSRRNTDIPGILAGG